MNEDHVNTAEPIVTSPAPGIEVENLMTRRKVLMQMGATALVTAAGAALVQAQSSGGGGQGAESSGTSFNPQNEQPTDPVTHNETLDKMNPDSFSPPPTDAGDVNTFKYPFAFGHNKVSAGGWARQVTERDLPVSKTLAGVNMRLKKGAIRELHWHVSAEWAFMLSGQARVTAVQSDGKAFVGDVGVGDLWFFPSGVPHSIQALSDDGCEFLLVFDDGNFSEFDTFLITDWMHHTPPQVLAKNFSLPESTFKDVPKHELYIFNAPVPPSLEQDKKAAIGPEGEVQNPFTFRMTAMAPDVSHKGGDVRIVDSSKFKASTTVAAALVRLKPGGLRELHWHPNADEWQFYLQGKARMTIFIGGGKARTMDFQEKDVGYIDQSVGHYIENTGDTDCVFLEMFKSSFYEDISLAQWISHLPPELVADHLKISEKVIESIPKEKLVGSSPVGFATRALGAKSPAVIPPGSSCFALLLARVLRRGW